MIKYESSKSLQCIPKKSRFVVGFGLAKESAHIYLKRTMDRLSSSVVSTVDRVFWPELFNLEGNDIYFHQESACHLGFSTRFEGIIVSFKEVV